MIRKLVIVRKKHVRPDVLGELATFVAGEPLKVSPVAWGDEAGLSHWGYVLDGMKLADWQALQAWDAKVGFATVLSLGDSKHPVTVEEALASVGLCVNQSA